MQTLHAVEVATKKKTISVLSLPPKTGGPCHCHSCSNDLSVQVLPDYSSVPLPVAEAAVKRLA